MTKVSAASLDPVLVGLLRTVVCLPAVALLLLIERPKLPRGVRTWGRLAAIGVVSFILFPVLFTLGQVRTSAAHGGLILGMLPIFTGLFVALADRTRPTLRWTVGVSIAFTGLAALIVVQAGDGDRAAGLWGDVLVLLSVISAAVGYIVGARLVTALGARTVTYWGVAVAAVLLLPWTAVELLKIDDWAAIPAEAWGGVLYLALLAQVMNYVLWYWALNAGGIARVAAVQFAQPIVTLVLAVTLFSEPLTASLLISAAVILTGVGLCQLRRA